MSAARICCESDVMWLVRAAGADEPQVSGRELRGGAEPRAARELTLLQRRVPRQVHRAGVQHAARDQSQAARRLAPGAHSALHRLRYATSSSSTVLRISNVLY